MTAPPPTEIPRPARMFTLQSVIRLVVGILLLSGLAQFVSVDEIWNAFRQAYALPLLLAAFLVTGNIGFQIVKWHYLLNLQDSQSSWKQSTASFFFGMTLGLLSPGQLGEFAGRAWRWEGPSPLRIVGLAIIDRMQAFMVICLGGFISTALIFFPDSTWAIALSVLLSIVVLLLFFAPRVIRKFLLAVGIGKIRFAWIQNSLDVLDSFTLRQLGVLFFLTSLFYGTIFLQLHLLVNAFTQTTFLQSFLGFSAMMLYKSFVPISLGDLGVREAASVFFFSLLDVPKSAIFNASLLLFAINIFLPALVGLLFLPATSRIVPFGRKSTSDSA